MAGVEIWNRLAQAADRGDLTLRLRPDDLKPVLRQLDTHIRELDALLRRADAVATVTGLGEFAIGDQLARKYVAKGVGPDSMSARLRELRDAARAMRDLFAKSMDRYDETESENAARYRRLRGDVG